MKNLKIRVATEAESKEAQELFFKLGYEWLSGGKKAQHLEQSCSSGFGYLVAWSTGCFTNVIQCGCGAEDAKEITLQELRDMVNPMKEYLTKNSSGNYQLVNHRFSEDDIEVPEGADMAFKKNMEMDYVSFSVLVKMEQTGVRKLGNGFQESTLLTTGILKTLLGNATHNPKNCRSWIL